MSAANLTVAVATMAALLATVCLGHTAQAHPLAPSSLRLVERDDGSVDVRWRTPLKRPAGQQLVPRVGPPCRQLSAPLDYPHDGALQRSWRLDCSEAGLVGTRVEIDGLTTAHVNVVVHATLADGRVVQQLLHSGEAQLVIPAGSDLGAVLSSYLALGIEHLLFGLDHLLLLLGFICLIGGRRLLLAITAFTVGHSLTLALAATGVLTLPAGPVELAIAASLVLIAMELTRPEGGVVARRPWSAALLIGLVHGLGFAGALSDVGLPADAIAGALFGFNLGIELAQLGLIALCLGLARAVAMASGPLTHDRLRVRVVATYLVGCLGAFWVLDRSIALVTGA